MKRTALIAALTLALALPPKVSAPPQPNYAVEIGIALTIIAVGTIVIIKCRSTQPIGPVTIVLYSSTDHSNWTPCATNYNVILDGRTPREVFTDQMTDSCKFYQAHIQP